MMCRSLALLVAMVPAAAEADAPWLSADQVAAVAGERCRWHFAATWSPLPDGRIERWSSTGCRDRASVNLALVRRSDGQIDVTVLLPGRTRQAPPVQRRATLEVLARASGPACRERRIVDTEIVERRGDVSVEHWTVEACGERRAFEVALETRAGELVALDIKDADGER